MRFVQLNCYQGKCRALQMIPRCDLQCIARMGPWLDLGLCIARCQCRLSPDKEEVLEPAPVPRHRRRRPGLVDEDQPVRREPMLPLPPALPRTSVPARPRAPFF